MQDFASELARQGMVVDVAIHAPDAKSDARNYHAHLLATMREVGPEGFGDKVRAWNSTAQFERWKERWSELGADHLDRAGFQREAERFRVGHLSLEKQREAALGRGDHEWAKACDREPTKHLGPRVTAMERRGVETRQGDVNLEIEARNEVRGVARDIRDTYWANRDPHAFAEALEQKHLMLARVNKDDARSYAAMWGMDGVFAPQVYEGEYVVITERAHLYRLTARTTGDQFQNIRPFLRPLDQQDFPSVEAAQSEMRKRSLVPSVDRDEVIQGLMHQDPPRPTPGYDPNWIDHGLHLIRNPRSFIESLDRNDRSAVPDGAKHLKLRGTDGHQIWWAYNSTGTADAFEKSLRERGLHLVRVTAEDARDSHTFHWSAKRFERHYPILEEGEHVVLNDRGRIFRLTDQNLGHQPREIKAHLASLNDTPLPSLRELQGKLHEEHMSRIDPDPKGPSLRTRTRRGLRPVLEIGRDAARMAGTLLEASALRAPGAVAETIGSSLESLFAPILTPEQKRQAAISELDRQETAERSARRRQEFERE